MRVGCISALTLALALPVGAATNYTLVGWNNLGMHCMDSDYSVFSILPPYNTIQGQVIQIINGNTARLLTSTNGFKLTYEAVADPDGSFNSTFRGKTISTNTVRPFSARLCRSTWGCRCRGQTRTACRARTTFPNDSVGVRDELVHRRRHPDRPLRRRR
jgi:hypothetical protein